MKITIQPELISSLIVTVILSIFFVYAGKKIREADPTKRPKGVVLSLKPPLRWFMITWAQSCLRNMRRTTILISLCYLHGCWFLTYLD